MAVARNKGLGKGLEALFGEVDVRSPNLAETHMQRYGETGDSVRHIDINDIKPNSAQPRQIFNEEKIDEMAASINAHGVLQPILLKKVEKGFEIVAGERRWRAARKAGLKEVPAIVKELSSEQLMFASLIENIQREDLNPIEEAKAFQKILDEVDATQEDVSLNVGKSRPYITNALRLLKLPPEIQDLVLGGKLTNGHARALISVENPVKQLSLAERIAAEGLTVREAEKLAREANERKVRPPKGVAAKDAEIMRIEEELREILGAKVSLRHSGNRGKLEIDYYDREELERLIEMLRSLK